MQVSKATLLETILPDVACNIKSEFGTASLHLMNFHVQREVVSVYPTEFGKRILGDIHIIHSEDISSLIIQR